MRQEKRDTSLIDQHVIRLCFYENVRRSNFFVNTKFWSLFIAQLAANVEISGWEIVGYDKLLFY